MSTILDVLKKEKNVKYVKMQIKVPEAMKDEIEFIVKHNEIVQGDYILKILEKSEIHKVYLATKKEQDKKKNASNDGSDNV